MRIFGDVVHSELHPNDQVINDRQENSAHLPNPPAHLQQTTFVGLCANDVKYVEVVFDRHLKIVEGIHSLNGSIYDKQKQKSVKGFVSEGTMVLRRRGSGAQKFDIRQVEKGQMSTTKR